MEPETPNWFVYYNKKTQTLDLGNYQYKGCRGKGTQG